MSQHKTLISVLELRRLMTELQEKRPDVCIRLRQLGEMWAVNFTRIILVTEKGAMLNDEVTDKLITIADLSNIMQFEIDNQFQNFQPHFHYDVKPDWSTEVL